MNDQDLAVIFGLRKLRAKRTYLVYDHCLGVIRRILKVQISQNCFGPRRMSSNPVQKLLHPRRAIRPEQVDRSRVMAGSPPRLLFKNQK